jgi:transcriptional regulator with XRE-family HTH domain
VPKSVLSGSRIRAMRVTRGLAQAEVARAAGVSASYLNLIEHNRRRAGPGLIATLAQALGVSAQDLSEGAEVALVETLRHAAVQVAGAGGEGGLQPELDRVDEFIGRFPGWAALIGQIQARAETLERSLERVSDRMAHDPKLSEALNEIISAVTAVQSTSAILVDDDEIEPRWRRKFQRNIHEDSGRLAASAEALVAYLDASGAEMGLATPQEEMEGWLARFGHDLAAIDAQGAAALSAPELASEAARGLAQGWLAQARSDASAMPLARLVPQLQAMWQPGGVFAPDVLARGFGVSLGQVFRRLASLPAIEAVPRFGLVICDGSGTLTYRRPIDGFALPRFGGACPLWPLFRALGLPGQPVRCRVETATRPAQRFVAHAVAEPILPPGFDGPVLWRALMLLSPQQDAAAGGEDMQVVGSSCRVCPRVDCPARREGSIVGG